MRQSPSIEELKRLLPQCLLEDQVRIGSRLAQALAALRRGSPVEVPLDEWLARARASAALRERRASVRRHLCYPEDLPIVARREEVVSAIRSHPVIVVAGETGSGKTTQVPKMCLEAGLGQRGRIGCTQPRRLAALSISRRLAEELDVEWGREVGCKIRFSDQTRPETSVKVMTDGMLLAELQGDPLLCEYEAILLDEAHERSLNIDFLLGHFRGLLQRRDDLKLIITSATIDTERFSAAFGGAPVIEVSGRLFPVEVHYRPLSPSAEEAEEQTYVDAAVSAVDEILAGGPSGDVLVFMPGERDIRETCDRLESRRDRDVEVLPLFGRLAGGDQQRIFSPGARRRVIVATNIAETSLTVPRIRYVVDTGLARVSRYHPGSRSQRLPVEPVSQSSARQRQGRCGRVTNGVCIRLYSEADFDERPRFAEPEIRRCDLADVLLRMKAFGLGEIETFPFLEPPSPAAIRAAYQLLDELGALDAARGLTPLGRELARLPVDPAIGRMLLQARGEGALREVLVIAAGLSIQDPRERPFDQRDTAEAAHRRFQHPESDFLTLWNIWNAFHDTWESLKTQNQLRKFCRGHFLSYLRMREWNDLHAQLLDAVQDLQGFRLNDAPATFDAIHRSILTGLLGHVAEWAERNTYRLAGSRRVSVFPASGLFEKPGPPARGKPAGEGPPSRNNPRARWVIAGELVETSRPYARTLARIEPAWVYELAPQLCRQVHEHPRWDAEAGRVLATEKVLFRGLVLREQTVGYGRVDPKAATELFLRAALVEGGLDAPQPFLAHNRALREKIEMWQTRLHQRVLPDLDEAFYRFYADRLHEVSSVHDLNRVVKAAGDREFLWARAADLLGDGAAAFESGAFPDQVALGTAEVPVSYVYAPGEERDGVTFRLSAPLLEILQPGQLDWAVPALREERLLQLLRALPKNLRRPLMPLDALARQILRDVPHPDATFLQRVSQYLRKERGVEIPVAAWPTGELPGHLRPRLEVAAGSPGTVVVGRDLRELRQQVERAAGDDPGQPWVDASRRWERTGLEGWDFGDLPDPLVVGEVAGFSVTAHPAVVWEGAGLSLRLFRGPAEALRANRAGWPRLAEKLLRREVTWMQKDLQGLRRWGPLWVTWAPLEELMETAWEHLRRHVFTPPETAPMSQHAFEQYLASRRERIGGASTELIERIGVILQKRHEVLLCRRPFPALRGELDSLLPRRFLEQVPWDRLPHLPRYLQALIVRAERAAVNGAKDFEKSRRVQPYAEAWAALARNRPGLSETGRAAAERFRWLLEEFKVSCFAQELGTAEPVSPRRLDAALAEAKAESPPAAAGGA